MNWLKASEKVRETKKGAEICAPSCNLVFTKVVTFFTGFQTEQEGEKDTRDTRLSIFLSV